MASVQRKMPRSSIRLGTRGSKLALAQADIVSQKLSEFNVKIVVIKTQGDQDITTPLSEMGGKGVFVKALEDALIQNEIDIAVHSLKDVTSAPNEGLRLAGFLKAESSADVLVSRLKLSELPQGAVIATGSMRRKALLKKSRPDIKTVDIRGNVDTRLKKLDEGGFDGLILSEAGLIRLGLADRVTDRLDVSDFIPAPGQGVITLETRSGEEDLASKISDPDQERLSRLELKFLEKVGFDCTVPLGLHAIGMGDEVIIHLFVANDDFSDYYSESIRTPWVSAEAQVLALADKINFLNDDSLKGST